MSTTSCWCMVLVSHSVYLVIILISLSFFFFFFFFFSSRRRHTRSTRDWSSDVCSSDLHRFRVGVVALVAQRMLDPHAVELDVRASLAVVRPADLAAVGAGDVESFEIGRAHV